MYLSRFGVEKSVAGVQDSDLVLMNETRKAVACLIVDGHRVRFLVKNVVESVGG